MSISKCRSCGQPIIWAIMKKSGKKNPLDAHPVETGNVILYDDLSGGPEKYAEVLSKEELAVKHADGELLHVSHFATCSKAASHRRKP